jgi:hypothetical protein
LGRQAGDQRESRAKAILKRLPETALTS